MKLHQIPQILFSFLFGFSWCALDSFDCAAPGIAQLESQSGLGRDLDGLFIQDLHLVESDSTQGENLCQFWSETFGEFTEEVLELLPSLSGS